MMGSLHGLGIAGVERRKEIAVTSVPQETIRFKFQWVNQDGNVTGLWRKRGSFDGEILVLDKASIPAGAITHVEIRDKRLLLAAMTEEGEPALLLLETSAGILKRLAAALNVARSSLWAEAHKRELNEQGRGHAYRDAVCPCCGATVVLSDMPHSPQLFCQFCGSLVTLGEPGAPAGERHFKLCDECGMFSKPRKFTVAYFYFLLVVYGVSQRVTWRCPACMRGAAWKMFFGNLLFVLFVPVAIVQLIRSYGGSVSGPFAGLDTANLKARRGDLAGALRIYNRISERVPYCAGVKYNVGQALLQQGRTPEAAEAFRLALEDCSNYAPAYGGLVRCYEQLGENEKLAELKRIWGTQGEEAK
jgi:tetratricopeptide (TPR) repeat protein